MKILGTMNGWKGAPHLWWRYLLLPLSWQVMPACWTSISLFGFVVFIETESQRKANERA